MVSNANSQPAIEEEEATVLETAAPEAVQAVEEPKITAAHEVVAQSRVRAIQAKINAGPKRRVRIPKALGEQIVIINGARWNIPANVAVEVPELVAQQLEKARRI